MCYTIIEPPKPGQQITRDNVSAKLHYYAHGEFCRQSSTLNLNTQMFKLLYYEWGVQFSLVRLSYKCMNSLSVNVDIFPNKICGNKIYVF